MGVGCVLFIFVCSCLLPCLSHSHTQWLFMELNYKQLFFLEWLQLQCQILVFPIKICTQSQFSPQENCCKKGGQVYSYSPSTLSINNMSVQVLRCDDGGDNNNDWYRVRELLIRLSTFCTFFSQSHNSTGKFCYLSPFCMCKAQRE